MKNSDLQDRRDGRTTMSVPGAVAVFGSITRLRRTPLPKALPEVARYSRCAALTIDDHSKALGRTTLYPAPPIIALTQNGRQGKTLDF